MESANGEGRLGENADVDFENKSGNLLGEVVKPLTTSAKSADSRTSRECNRNFKRGVERCLPEIGCQQGHCVVS